MKTIKYLLIGAMLTVSTGMSAQTADYQPQLNAIYKVLKENPGKPDAAKNLVKAYEKAYKKDPAALVALGYGFLSENHLDKAKYYADLVLKKNKTCGDAYVLLGDIEQQKEEGGQAAMWYKNAMSMDPKNPNGYIKYANIYRKDPATFDDTMNKLKKEVPSYPIEAESGHSYFIINDYKSAYNYYSKSNQNTNDEQQTYEYAQAAYFTGNADKALEVAQKGISRFPNSNVEKALTRYALYSAVDLGKYTDAEKYANFMERSDMDLIYNDFQNIGKVYLAEEKYNEAIERFNKALEKKDDAYLNYQLLSEAYAGLGEEDQAISFAEKYLSLASSVKVSDFTKLADIYSQKAVEAQKAEDGNVDLYMEKSMGVFDRMIEKFPQLKTYGILQQGNVAFKLNNNALAQSKWLAVIDLLQDKSDRTAREVTDLTSAYRQLGALLWADKDKGIKAAAPYLDRLVELDPEDNIAKRYLEAISK